MLRKGIAVSVNLKPEVASVEAIRRAAVEGVKPPQQCFLTSLTNVLDCTQLQCSIGAKSANSS
jgi:hypothetical protein